MFYNEWHIAKWQRQILLEHHPVVILTVKSVAIRKFERGLFGIFQQLDQVDLFEAFDGAPLFDENTLRVFSDHHVARVVPKNLVSVIWHIEKLDFYIFLDIPK